MNSEQHYCPDDSGCAYCGQTLPADPRENSWAFKGFCDGEKAENVRSVNYRYKESDEFQPVQMGRKVTVANRDKQYTAHISALRLAPVTVLKICACVDYQSCETNDWELTLAAEILRRIVAMAIRRLPGYDEAPWGIDDKLSVKDVA